MIYGHSRYVSTCMWKGQYPLCYLRIDGKARPNNIHTNIQEPTNESVFECISLSISRKKSGIDILKQYFSDVFFRFDEAV